MYNDTQCIPCRQFLEGCEFCSKTTPESDPEVCWACGAGYFLNSTTRLCDCKIKHCNKCTANGCDDCEEFYHVDERQNCELNDCDSFNFHYCYKCTEDACHECIEGYFLDGKKCIKPYKAFLGIIIVYAVVVVIVWIILLVGVRPRLIK